MVRIKSIRILPNFSSIKLMLFNGLKLFRNFLKYTKSKYTRIIFIQEVNYFASVQLLKYAELQSIIPCVIVQLPKGKLITVSRYPDTTVEFVSPYGP